MEAAETPIFPVRILGRTSGFTLLELLVVVLLLAIFLTFASVNWVAFSSGDKDTFLEQFSVQISLVREDAVASFEERVMEVDLNESTIAIGRIDLLTGFVPIRDVPLPNGYKLRDIVLNGRLFSIGKSVMRFHPEGFVDRLIMHVDTGNDSMYTLLVNPLTARVEGKDGYVEEISVTKRDNPS